MSNYLNTCKTFTSFEHSFVDKEVFKPFQLSRLFQNVRVMYRRSLQREHLKTLEPRLLNDIGLTFKEAEIEANKPFWKA